LRRWRETLYARPREQTSGDSHFYSTERDANMEHIQRDDNQTFRHRVARWRETFFAQKYRFDLGQSFLVVVNFALLMISASDKLMLFFGIPRLRSLLVLIAPLCLLGVWSFGYFMDKIVRAGQMVERQQVQRSEVWSRHNDQMNRIETQLQELQKTFAISRTVPKQLRKRKVN
jgi:hypothetical protein